MLCFAMRAGHYYVCPSPGGWGRVIVEAVLDCKKVEVCYIDTGQHLVIHAKKLLHMPER